MTNFAINNTAQKGFTLVEFSIVATIVGILLYVSISTSLIVIDSARVRNTEKKLDEIEKALYNYQLSFGDMPCPADPDVVSSNSLYGVSNETSAGSYTEGTCTITLSGYSAPTGTYVGTIPTRTLGLPDDYMYDGWGNRIDYIVDAKAVNYNLFGNNMVLVGSPTFDTDSWRRYAGPSDATVTNPLGTYPAVPYVDTVSYHNFIYPGKNGYAHMSTPYAGSAGTLSTYMLNSTSNTTVSGQVYKLVFDSLATNNSIQVGFSNIQTSTVTAGSSNTITPTYGKNIVQINVGTTGLPYFKFYNGSIGVQYEVDNAKLYLVNAVPTSTMPIDIFDSTDSNGNAATTEAADLINGAAVYVLISHGSNGYGAYTKLGIRKTKGTGSTSEYEIENAHVGGTYDAEFRVGPINDTAATATYFDDMVRWKPYEQLRYRESLQDKI